MLVSLTVTGSLLDLLMPPVVFLVASFVCFA